MILLCFYFSGLIKIVIKIHLVTGEWSQSKCRPVVSKPIFILNPGLVLVLGYWQTTQAKIRRLRTRRLFRVFTVCLNNKQLRVERNSLKTPFLGLFPAYIQRQLTHQCCSVPCHISDNDITKTCQFKYTEHFTTKN